MSAEERERLLNTIQFAHKYLLQERLVWALQATEHILRHCGASVPATQYLPILRTTTLCAPLHPNVCENIYEFLERQWLDRVKSKALAIGPALDVAETFLPVEIRSAPVRVRAECSVRFHRVSSDRLRLQTRLSLTLALRRPQLRQTQQLRGSGIAWTHDQRVRMCRMRIARDGLVDGWITGIAAARSLTGAYASTLGSARVAGAETELEGQGRWDGRRDGGGSVICSQDDERGLASMRVRVQDPTLVQLGQTRQPRDW
ncbi:hypothetical protein K438DRAFT_1952935 [Mycena galopus ATCC 62051]|nr:hypothetical protein K438DRAFT_1952935 [Mycena galopus ATCC 62051]